jgi:uncharacterized protein
VRIFVLLAAMLLTQLARADLFTAQLAYQKGDFEAAAKDYRSMAELGNAIAQYDLAVLYLNGQGVKQSELNAYAWAQVAAANGHAPAKTLADRLRPNLAPGSEKIARDMVAAYDRAALDAEIMPKIHEDQNGARCKFLTFPHAEYPDEAQDKGQSGSVFVEFTVAPDGSARNPRAVYAVPNDAFDSTARSSTLGARLATGPDAVHCHYMMRFEIGGAVTYPQLQSFADKTLKSAKDGDANAQFLYGVMLAGLPQMGKSYSDALPWFLKAAQGGQPAAQYQVGSSLLFGIGCQCEVNKGEVWLRRAAEAGQPDAQVTLGTYALRGDPSAADMKIAQIWLERAVAHGDHEGMYYLAALLAAAPDAQVRDPTRALRLLEQLKRDREGNPSILEIRAAAQASAGDFDAAKSSEQHAIDRAKRLKWDLVPLNERLARYESGQAWYGNLLTL